MILQNHKSNIIKAFLALYLGSITVIKISHTTLTTFSFAPSFSEIRYNLIPFNFLLERIRTLNELVAAGYNITLKEHLLNTWPMMTSFGYNILLFLPLGFLLPLVYEKYQTFKKIILTSFIIALCFETAQLFIMATTITSNMRFDMDDLIANTIGGVIGFGIYLLLRKVGSTIGFEKHSSNR